MDEVVGIVSSFADQIWSAGAAAAKGLGAEAWTLWSALSHATEFWSAIIGAIVGGLIAYLVQVKALREGREQREEDQKQVQQALANSLLFKIARINAGIKGILEHIEDEFADAAKKGIKGEPWQFVRPLANPPDPVHFSPEEMGMLLSLRNDEAFNRILPLDLKHNSLMDAVRVLNSERNALALQLKPEKADGTLLSGRIAEDQFMLLRPLMINVNTLIESVLSIARADFHLSDEALDNLQELLRDKLGLSYRLIRQAPQKASQDNGTTN